MNQRTKVDTLLRKAFWPMLAAALTTHVSAQTTASTSSGESDGNIIELSPFEVDASGDVGYYAENTLAGSRLNSNIADIAASITVVTRQQMEDTASVDINDLFRYEANTEGSSSYSPSIVDRGTVKDSVAGYTLGNDGSTTTNAQSNRIRGLNAPDAAINNFSTNSRIPLDAYNTQSIEISRGPNSLLFGLGTPAGVVNVNTSSASLARDATSLAMRVDHNGSFRTSIGLNRVLVPDKLAVYFAALYDDRQFERKPSSDRYRRQYAAFTLKPFARTTLKGFFENYRNDANRPNFYTPRDQVTPWIQSGRPVYDSVARTITILDTGEVKGPYVTNTNSPGYNSAVNTIVGVNAVSNTTSPLYVPGIIFDDVGRPLRIIENGESTIFMQRQPAFYREAHTNPQAVLPNGNVLGWGAGGTDNRYLLTDRMWTASANLLAPTTVINGTTYRYGSYNWAGITDQSIYDWTKYNTVQSNFAQVKAKNINLEFEQQILDNLHFSAGWLRQDIDEASNYIIAQLQGATMGIDTNLRLPDGSANPYYGLPFMYEGAGGGNDTFYSPQVDDNYRAMLAYQYDFTKKDNWMRWLGNHRAIGTWQRQESLRTVERWRMNFVDGEHITKMLYTRNHALNYQANWSATATMRHYYMASPGDPMAQVTQSIGFYGNRGWDQPYASQLRVWNQNSTTWEDADILESSVFADNGSFKTDRIVDGMQVALQSNFLDGRLVTTLGWREDTVKTRRTTAGAITVNGVVVEPFPGNEWLFTGQNTGEINYDNVMNRWTPYQELSGDTKTVGVAFRPFRDFGPLSRSENFFSGLLRGMTFYYNQSDNFNPPTAYQTDYFKRELPKPTGEGKDYGVGINLFDNKLVARVSWYETTNANERTGAAGTLLTRLAYSDTTTGLPWASTVLRIQKAMAAGRTLNPDADDPNSIFFNEDWNSNTQWDISSETDQRALYDMIQLPYLYYSGVAAGATQQSKAKGVELQLTYNPTPSWTMKLTGAKNEASYTSVAPQYDEWLAERLPVWESLTSTIPDFVDPNNGRAYSLRNFWTGYGFTNVAYIENTNGNVSPQAYFNNVVASEVANAKALEGAVSPLSRKYRASFLTNYTVREGKWKGNSFGGSLRWESKAAIGYFGKVGNPIQAPTVINIADITRPVWGDNGNYYTDLWISHTRRIYNDKIRMKIQLNCNNAFEGGRLLATHVNLDGSPWAYRIIDPRVWQLSASFEF
ncbi:hypothetical protein ASA1KI_13190 [Opitutales bacterium ASA1]|uniref:TonB-dependent receptor plug domain-containing protein n=1 Tax=Congregicoccus parvus TaxID=3081749 RepID=UPI002B31E3D9|nr:hypothetical protein ASA1KI_13190 [Opitutales bacterium ASA1]